MAMTQIEMRFFESAVSFFNSFGKKKEIDWEQRRYEIAKECMSGSASTNYNSLYLAQSAVANADALIAELKKNSQVK